MVWLVLLLSGPTAMLKGCRVGDESLISESVIHPSVVPPPPHHGSPSPHGSVPAVRGGCPRTMSIAPGAAFWSSKMVTVPKLIGLQASLHPSVILDPSRQLRGTNMKAVQGPTLHAMNLSSFLQLLCLNGVRTNLFQLHTKTWPRTNVLL